MKEFSHSEYSENDEFSETPENTSLDLLKLISESDDSNEIEEIPEHEIPAYEYFEKLGYEKAADYAYRHCDEFVDIREGKPVIHFDTRNEELEGFYHNTANIEFKRKAVDYGDFIIDGVWAEFESYKDVDLGPEAKEMTEAQQFERAKELLLEELYEDSDELLERSTLEDMDKLNGGYTIAGLTPHHNPLKGPYVISYCDSTPHKLAGHTGWNAFIGKYK